MSLEGFSSVFLSSLSSGPGLGLGLGRGLGPGSPPLPPMCFAVDGSSLHL